MRPRRKRKNNDATPYGSSPPKQKDIQSCGKAKSSFYKDKGIPSAQLTYAKPKSVAKARKLQEYRFGCPILNVLPEKLSEITDNLKTIRFPTPPSVQSIRHNGVYQRYKCVENSAFKSKFIKTVSGNISKKISVKSTCDLQKDFAADERYFREEASKSSNSKVREMLKFRQKLPAWNKRLDLLKALEIHNVILVTGETGCGKTTQVAQFVLEDAIRSGKGSQTYIICTQPRRISAITVAERVASERGESLGTSVGYQIRLEKVLPRPSAAILFCSTGILLQYMHGDPLLTKVSTVIVDEIHERNTISDFVITLLRDISPLRPDLKIILMSATLNSELFSKYFNYCPKVHIPGFTFSVDEHYLEDVLERLKFSYSGTFSPKVKKGSKGEVGKELQILENYYKELESERKYSEQTIKALKDLESNEINLNLISELIFYICANLGQGAILVFLPGWDKISSLNKLLTTSGKFPQSRYRIIPLHSLMPTGNQKRVFERPPRGIRKIVLATNVAETSITIDDVVYVIDSGKVKMKNFDVDCNVSTLKEEWVSRASAKQRRGRAGRVQHGVCFHLFSKGREKLLAEHILPEILRTRLEEVILQGKILQVGKISPFLQKILDPPSAKAVQLSLETLKSMNALDEEENLTPLGFHLGNLPIDPQVGKMLIFGSLFGILDPVSSIASVLGFKDPFITPLGQEREVVRIRKSFDCQHKSDHLIHAKIISQYEEAAAQNSGWSFADKHFLSSSILDQLVLMKDQLVTTLHDMKYAPSSSVSNEQNNVNSHNLPLVRAVICASFFPNVAAIKTTFKTSGQTSRAVFTVDNQRVQFHPKSIFFYTSNTAPSKYLVYFEKQRSTNIYLHDCTMVHPFTLILFSHDLKISERGDFKVIEVCENITFKCSKELAKLLVDLRSWLEWIIEYKMCHPGYFDWNKQSEITTVLRAIIDLITYEEEDSIIEISDEIEANATDEPK